MDQILSLFSYWHYGPNGNGILLLLLFTSILGVGVFFERIWQLRQAEIDTQKFMITLRDHLEQGGVIASIELCEKSMASIPRMIRSGLLRHEKSSGHMEAAMEISGKLEIARLEKNAKILSLVAHIAPLIGLLGTVLGFIQAFAEMRMSGLVDISTSRLGEAMEYALVTTAAGLVVAIPSVIAYNYLVGRIEKIVLEMQATSTEVIELFQEHNPYV